MNTFELNNIQKDAVVYSGTVTKHSPVVEVFSAMTNGSDIAKFGKVGDEAVKYIKALGAKAGAGDTSAAVELNTIRRFAIETPIMEELKLLNIFGTYQNVGYDESIEREVYKHSGDFGREQAANGDVTFPVTTSERYPVASTNISGGYAVDYRRVELGDMSKENEGLNMVKTDILNKAKLYVMKKVYEAIKNATGVKYAFEGAGLTKAGVDKVINDVRRFGRPTVIGDYALISQFTPWAGFTDGAKINNVSQKVMEEIAATGKISAYNGTILAEMENPYNEYAMNAEGTNFSTLLPTGIGFVIPAGVNSPIMTWTRGGLTSMQGNDVKTGKVCTRFDIEIAADCAKGREHCIGLITDTNLTTL